MLQKEAAERIRRQEVAAEEAAAAIAEAANSREEEVGTDEKNELYTPSSFSTPPPLTMRLRPRGVRRGDDIREGGLSL